MGIFALFSVLKARRWVLITAILAGGAVALAIGVVLPREFESVARVQVDSRHENPLTGLYEPRVRINEFLGQQSAVASSRTVGLKVYDRLVEEGFFLPETFTAEWREKTGGELVAGNDVRLWVADKLLDKLEIRANSLESTLEFAFRSDQPDHASRLANTFAQSYMDVVFEQRQRRRVRNAANFDDETTALQDDIERAQRDLTRFREQEGIIGDGARRLEDIEVELAAVTLRLANARTDLAEAQSLLRQARDADPDELVALPLPAEARAGRQAQARLGSVQVQAQRLAERYGPEYPPFVEAQNEKLALQRTVMQAVEERADYAARRVAALDAAAQRQKQEVVALQEIKQNYDVLSKRVDASRSTYDLVATRSLQESLQARVDIVEVFMLARAVPPKDPTMPPLGLIVALGFIAGGMIGASAAVAIELVEGRIRTKNAIANALNAPVFGEVALPSYRRKATA
ncbi:MAG: Wzz/FepE/Etk N-terminal domain-containing protein [Pseudomonadota bacterium]